MPDWSIAIGAQLEICSDRACTRVLQTVAATGCSGTVPADLPAGVVFWRLRTRTRDAVGTSVSPTWVLYIEPGTCPLGPFAIRVDDDYDGDGIRDNHRVEGRDVVVNYSTGIPSTPLSLPADSRGSDGPYTIETLYTNPGGVGIGDVSGDGRSDFAWFYDHTHHAGSAWDYDRLWVSQFSGPRGVTEPGSLGDSIRGRLGVSSWGLRVYSAGDIDRDGYGDVLAYRQTDPLIEATGRYITRRGEWIPPGGCGTDVLQIVDINGDSVGDAVVDLCPGSGRPLRSSFALGDVDRGGFGPAHSLPGCDVLGVRSGDIGFAGGVDANCDGYEDVTAYSGAIRFVLFGGPDGLSSARCAALPAGP